MYTMGIAPNAAPWVADTSAKFSGIWNPTHATMTATMSATMAETWARAFTPNSMMKNVSSGTQATKAERPSDPAMGSIDAWNM